MHKSFDFNFEWDPSKAVVNYRKHGITFEAAATVFNDPNALTIFDQNHSQDEDRWVTLGLDVRTLLLVVHHTYLDKSKEMAYIRIISARKATKNEVKQYWEKS